MGLLEGLAVPAATVAKGGPAEPAATAGSSAGWVARVDPAGAPTGLVVMAVMAVPAASLAESAAYLAHPAAPAAMGVLVASSEVRAYAVARVARAA
ncbi:MAG TPA: hypothetical protein VFW69_18320 [Mycobacterium sp.]|nr:hypothetical protein [Mycobacterium sp.]